MIRYRPNEAACPLVLRDSFTIFTRRKRDPARVSKVVRMLYTKRAFATALTYSTIVTNGLCFNRNFLSIRTRLVCVIVIDSIRRQSQTAQTRNSIPNALQRLLCVCSTHFCVCVCVRLVEFDFNVVVICSLCKHSNTVFAFPYWRRPSSSTHEIRNYPKRPFAILKRQTQINGKHTETWHYVMNDKGVLRAGRLFTLFFPTLLGKSFSSS